MKFKRPLQKWLGSSDAQPGLLGTNLQLPGRGGVGGCGGGEGWGGVRGWGVLVPVAPGSAQAQVRPATRSHSANKGGAPLWPPGGRPSLKRTAWII